MLPVQKSVLARHFSLASRLSHTVKDFPWEIFDEMHWFVNCRVRLNLN
jgi:hypothetical protein